MFVTKILVKNLNIKCIKSKKSAKDKKRSGYKFRIKKRIISSKL